MKPWLQTFSKKTIDVFEPDPNQIDIIDIAISLSRQCRFNGHTKEFYSVAEHCVHVSEITSTKGPGFIWGNAMFGLLHDASEAYLTDLPRPVKVTDEMAKYRVIEQELQSVIYHKFGCVGREPELIKRCDNMMLATEALQLMFPAPDGKIWELNEDPIPNFELHCWSPTEACKEFLDRFKSLQKFEDLS